MVAPNIGAENTTLQAQVEVLTLELGIAKQDSAGVAAKIVALQDERDQADKQVAVLQQEIVLLQNGGAAERGQLNNAKGATPTVSERLANLPYKRLGHASLSTAMATAIAPTSAAATTTSADDAVKAEREALRGALGKLLPDGKPPPAVQLYLDGRHCQIQHGNGAEQARQEMKAAAQWLTEALEHVHGDSSLRAAVRKLLAVYDFTDWLNVGEHDLWDELKRWTAEHLQTLGQPLEQIYVKQGVILR